MLAAALQLVQHDAYLCMLIKQSIASNTLLIYQLCDILDFAALESDSFYYKWAEARLEDIFTEVSGIYEEACKEKDIKLILDNRIPNLKLRTDYQRVM